MHINYYLPKNVNLKYLKKKVHEKKMDFKSLNLNTNVSLDQHYIKHAYHLEKFQ